MLVIVIAVLGFIMIAGLGFVFAGSGDTKVVKRAQALSAASNEARKASSRTAGSANAPDARRKQIVKSLKEQERKQRKATLAIGAKLQQAGLSLKEPVFWIISGVFGVLVFVVVMLLGLHILIALGAAFAAGLGVPRWIVGFLAKRRIKKFTLIFSDAIDIIVRGIRSGLPVHDCLKIIGRETAEPLGGEFRRLNENVSVGMGMDQALEKMFERMPTPELRFFAIVLAIQQKTGGNLAEALNNLSTILRARKMMREKIKALSSEAVASSFIIGSLPPGVVVLIMVTSPAYMSVMFTDPRGHMLLLIGAVMMTCGILVMRRMINFKF